MRIKCTTLFDITRTNVNHRRNLDLNLDNLDYYKLRSQQSNFETILQIISMRSQPEDISDPNMNVVSYSDLWGKEYKKYKKIPTWSFTFSIQHNGVFDNGTHELGHLFSDCNQVPMIIKLNECELISPKLDTTTDLKNIHFERIYD